MSLFRPAAVQPPYQPQPLRRAPAASGSAVLPATAYWHQEGGNAARTGSGDVTPASPWRWLWAWNGADANGAAGGYCAPIASRATPIATATRLVVPMGSRGITCLDLITGAEVWSLQSREVVATPAYHEVTDTVLMPALDGYLYRVPMNAPTMATIRSYQAGSPIMMAPLVVGNNAYVTCEDGSLHKVAINSGATAPSLVWRYAGGSSAGFRAETPPAYSAVTGKIVYATADGYVHAVTDSSGAASWRVAPHSSLVPSPGWGGSHAIWEGGWPVVADQHGVVFMRCGFPGLTDNGPISLGPSTVNGNGNMPPDADAATAGGLIRTWFGTRASPGSGGGARNLFALSLSDGSEAFVPAAMYTSVEDKRNGALGWSEMHQMPVVKVWPNGDEVVYLVFRNSRLAQDNSWDFRWTGFLGEMVLDGTTISGLAAGDFRFMQSANTFMFIVDEACPLMMSGDTLLHGHWGASEHLQVIDRSGSLGLDYTTPIITTTLPPVMRQAILATPNPATHQSASGAGMVSDGRTWSGPIFWELANVDTPVYLEPNPFVGRRPTTTLVAGQYVIVSSAAGILCFRHSGGLNGAPPAPTPTALVLPGPTRGNAAEASGYFTVKLDPPDAILAGGTVTVTPHDGGAGVTFKNEAGSTITQLALTQSTPAQRFTVVPPSGAAGTTVNITLTNDGGLANP